ncbi:MAG: glycosyltransferase family 4 protein [Candidatus Dormibacteria bacterium]
MSRVLIATNEVIGPRMAGPAIRCLELGRQLQSAGHRVTLLGAAGTGLDSVGLEILPGPRPAEISALAHKQDAVVVQGLALRLHPELRDPDVPLVVDLYDPFPLALLEQERQRSMADRWALSTDIAGIARDLLAAGDFFICASERQRDLWLGALMASGRVNPATWTADDSLRQLLDVVPFGLPEGKPEPDPSAPPPWPPGIAADDLVLLWAGGIYNWFDPLTLIRAVAMVGPQYPRLKLLFMATGHPNPGVPPRMWMPRRATELAKELGILGKHVFFNREWIPYETRGDWLGRASCGVSTHFDHAETRFSFRTRVLDYLWAGLPVIATRGDVLADLIESRDLGWTVPAGDVELLAKALTQLAGASPDARQEISRRVRVVAAQMTWTIAAQPLLRFCALPRPAADLPGTKTIAAPMPSGRLLRGGPRLARRGLQSLRQSGVRATLASAQRWWRHRRSG